MGSIGTSPKRSAGVEAQNQLHILADPSTPADQETPEAVSNHNNATRMDRVEQLLAQLETKPVALVPNGYWNQAQAQPNRSNQWAIAAVLACIWLSSLALAIAYFSYKHSSQVADRDVLTTPLVIAPPSDQQVQKTTESVSQLTKALLNSSIRLNHMEAVLQKSNLDLQRLKTKVSSEETKTIIRQPEAVPVAINNAAASDSTLGKAKQDAAVTLALNQVAASALKPSLSAPSVAGPPKATYQVLSVKPTDAAIPHKAADGTIDYWLVAHGAFKDLHKVQPIAIAADGIVVHSLEDGKNYTLTRQGDWRKAEW